MHPFPSKTALDLLAHLCVLIQKGKKRKKRGGEITKEKKNKKMTKK